jgi:uroporphyrinogen decarboxylase
MGLICCHAGGMYEHLSYLMSTEGLCIALYENPELVQAVSDRLGELMVKYYEHLLSLDRLIAIFPGDDMGFRSATMISPAALRTYTLPWHKRFAAMTHARGLPYFLHSCGNLTQIMDTLIDDVQIDGKHSYEDAIIPVDEFQARYGSRIACLGGVDINTLAAGTPDDVRRRTRWLMETCGARGRYAIGSGNSIPSYIPLQNYLAMVDEALS